MFLLSRHGFDPTTDDQIYNELGNRTDAVYFSLVRNSGIHFELVDSRTTAQQEPHEA